MIREETMKTLADLRGIYQQQSETDPSSFTRPIAAEWTEAISVVCDENKRLIAEVEWLKMRQDLMQILIDTCRCLIGQDDGITKLTESLAKFDETKPKPEEPTP